MEKTRTDTPIVTRTCIYLGRQPTKAIIVYYQYNSIFWIDLFLLHITMSKCRRQFFINNLMLSFSKINVVLQWTINAFENKVIGKLEKREKIRCDAPHLKKCIFIKITIVGFITHNLLIIYMYFKNEEWKNNQLENICNVMLRF